MIYGKPPTLVGLHCDDTIQGMRDGRPAIFRNPYLASAMPEEKPHPPLGFGPVKVAAEATLVITCQLQYGVFKPRRLYVPSSLGLSFSIKDVKIGRYSQLGPTPIQAFAFGEDMPDPGIEFDPVQVGQCVAIEVVNDTHHAEMFTACLVGGDGARNAPSAPRAQRRDPIRLCDHCGAPPKRGHAPDACYYCQRKR